MSKASEAAIMKRISGYKKLNRPRYYLVTFDLKRSAGRQALYTRFKRRLEKILGRANVGSIIKQCYFVKSTLKSSYIRAEMQTILAPQDSILIARLQPGYSYSLKKPGSGRRAKQYFKALREDEAGG